jgi:hypothetical protein
VVIPAITKQACRSRDRAGDQDHLSIQTIIVEPVKCRPSRRNHQGLVCADGVPPRNALPVDEASTAIQPNRVTIAIRNEALPEGKIRNTTKSALAAIETTRFICVNTGVASNCLRS